MSARQDGWTSVDELPEEPDDYLVSCETDYADEVTIMEFVAKDVWLVNGEPTYELPYYIKPLFWRPKPLPAKRDPS